jgi:hypothetical protein
MPGPVSHAQAEQILDELLCGMLLLEIRFRPHYLCFRFYADAAGDGRPPLFLGLCPHARFAFSVFRQNAVTTNWEDPYARGSEILDLLQRSVIAVSLEEQEMLVDFSDGLRMRLSSRSDHGADVGIMLSQNEPVPWHTENYCLWFLDGEISQGKHGSSA